MAAQSYLLASRQLLEQARNELAGGNTRQASEKGWKAAAQLVKAIAEQRGWEHKTHRQIWQAVRRLNDENRNIALSRLFRTPNCLHSNFYEDLDAPDDVTDALNDVERFIDLLEPLIR